MNVYDLYNVALFCDLRETVMVSTLNRQTVDSIYRNQEFWEEKILLLYGLHPVENSSELGRERYFILATRYVQFRTGDHVRLDLQFPCARSAYCHDENTFIVITCDGSLYVTIGTHKAKKIPGIKAASGACIGGEIMVTDVHENVYRIRPDLSVKKIGKGGGQVYRYGKCWALRMKCFVDLRNPGDGNIPIYDLATLIQFNTFYNGYISCSNSNNEMHCLVRDR